MSWIEIVPLFQATISFWKHRKKSKINFILLCLMYIQYQDAVFKYKYNNQFYYILCNQVIKYIKDNTYNSTHIIFSPFHIYYMCINTSFTERYQNLLFLAIQLIKTRMKPKNDWNTKNNAQRYFNWNMKWTKYCYKFHSAMLIIKKNTKIFVP